MDKFSGYLAIDELYDGPFCVLSIVDNRTYRRLAYRVLDHAPKSADITRFLKAFRKQLDKRGLKVSGITTDGSALYPAALALVYHLFDRRCRSDTALEKLARLRRRAKRFKEVGKTLQKLYSPNLEKALTFLDDKLLPSTSNAVERGNRRHRKMQKTICRVRTKDSLEQRMALDLLREMQADGRHHAARTLHRARTPTRFRPDPRVVETVTVL